MRSLIALLVVPTSLFAQSVAPLDFPADAARVSADALRERLSGKVFSVKLADGNGWRLEYKANGYAFVDTSTGFRDTGTWRTEDSRLCSEFHKSPAGCSEVRLAGDLLLVKRVSTGELVAFQPR
jgi:hypothetical protein